MSNNSYDLWGWYDSTGGYPERQATTSLATAPSSPVVGQPYPNWTGSEWVMLPYVKPPESQEVTREPDPRLLWLDVGPFYDRFGADALAIAASDHGACKAVQTLTGVRKYIDLADPRIGTMIDMLIATAQPAAVAFAPGSGPMTAAKKAAILNPVTTEHERYVKGLQP